MSSAGNKCRAGKHYVIFNMGEIPCTHLQDTCQNTKHSNIYIGRCFTWNIKPAPINWQHGWKISCSNWKIFSARFPNDGECKGHSKAGKTWNNPHSPPDQISGLPFLNPILPQGKFLEQAFWTKQQNKFCFVGDVSIFDIWSGKQAFESHMQQPCQKFKFKINKIELDFFSVSWYSGSVKS